MQTKTFTHESVLASFAPLQHMLDRERDFEREAMERAAARYWKKADSAAAKGKGGSTKAPERLIDGWLDELESLIEGVLKAAKKGEVVSGVGVIANVLHITSNPRPRMLAMMTLNIMVSWCMRHPDGANYTGVCESVGREVLTELVILRASRNRTRIEARNKDGEPYKDQHGVPITYGIVRTLKKRLGSAGNRSHVRRWLRTHSIMEPEEVRKSVCIHVGAWLCGAACNIAGLVDQNGVAHKAFEKRTIMVRKNYNKRSLFLSEICRDEIMRSHQHLAMSRPLYWPMLASPEPRTPDGKGGYLLIPTRFIIRASRRQRAWIKDTSPDSPWFRAVNIQAQTARRVHPVLQKLSRHIQREGGWGIDAFEPFVRPPKPALPEGHDPTAPKKKRWARVDPEVHAKYRAAASEWYKNDNELQSRAVSFAEIIDRAERLAPEQSIYFNYVCDSRGRFVPKPVFLNNHQSDLPRAMLEFGEKTPLGPDGEFWLKVHAASRWGHGLDKLSLPRRVAWVDEHREMIRRIAHDPTANREWLGSEDEPFGFLAACIALEDPDEHGTRCPVQLDATCSGLQQLAMMTRDAVTAPLVNLLPPTNPDEDPADVYTTGADKAKEIGAAKGVPQRVLDMITRKKVAKPKFMTTFYNSKDGQQALKIKNHLLDKVGLDKDEAKEHAKTINGLLNGALDGLCPGPMAMMRWLRDCADAHTEAGRCVSFYGPNGWLTEQAGRLYIKRGRFGVNTPSGHFWIRTTPTYDIEPKSDKQRNGIAANVTHTWDAAHAAAAIVAMDPGPIGYIHDCAENPAGRCARFRTEVARTLVEIHQEAAPAMLFKQWRESGLDVPEPPPPGELDIEQARVAVNMYC